VVRDQGLDRRPLVIPEPGVVTGERAEVLFCFVPELVNTELGHAFIGISTIEVVTDIVSIRGLRVAAVIGAYDWERDISQELVISVDMAADVPRAAASDDLADALNYAAVAETITAVVRDGKFALIETAASRVAERLLADYGLGWIRVEVVKPRPAEGFSAAVTIERTS
jgi:7,8-dihydroneopterin aldolase/epimerase/oxygenase